MPSKDRRWSRPFRGGIGVLRNAFQRKTDSSSVEKVVGNESTFDVLPSMVPPLYKAAAPPNMQDLAALDTSVPPAFAAWTSKSGPLPSLAKAQIRSLQSISTCDSRQSSRSCDVSDSCSREALFHELRLRDAKVLMASTASNKEIDALATASIDEESDSETEGRPVVVAVQVPSTMKERGVVQRVIDTERKGPTIVLLLRGGTSWAPDGDRASRRATLAEETTSFLQIGADGVELEPRSVGDLEDLLTMWLSCATQRRLASIQQAKDTEDYESDGNALKQAARKRETDLFWGAAHRVFKDFPRLAQELAEPVLGGKFGKSHVVDELLGSGGGGDVFLARNVESRQPRALKCVPKQDLSSYHKVEAVSKEIQALRKLKHQNIVTFFGAAHTCEHILILQECPGTRNLHRLQRESIDYALPPVQAHAFFRQIAGAIAYCHSQDVVHRDLKQENIIVCRDSATIKLIDFGTAERMGVGLELCGTVPFIAPEVLSNESTTYNAGKADVWGLGMILLEMLCGLNCVPDLLRWPMPAEPQASFAKDLRLLVSNWTPLAHAIESKVSLTPDLCNLLRDSMNSVVALRQTSADLVANGWLVQELRCGHVGCKSGLVNQEGELRV